jgi:hypothetical protein
MRTAFPARADTKLDKIEMRALAAARSRRMARHIGVVCRTPCRLFRTDRCVVIPATAKARCFKISGGVSFGVMMCVGVSANPCREFVNCRRPFRKIRIHCRRSVRICVYPLFQHMRAARGSCNMIKRNSPQRQNFVHFAFCCFVQRSISGENVPTTVKVPTDTRVSDAV